MDDVTSVRVLRPVIFPASSVGLDVDRFFRTLVARDPAERISLDEIEPDADLVRLLPAEAWRRHSTVPLFSIEDQLVVAMPELQDGEPFLREFLGKHSGMDVEIIEVPTTVFHRTLARFGALLGRHE